MIRVFTSHIIGRIHFSTYPSCNILVVCYHFTVWKFKFPFLCVSLFVTLQSYYHYTVFKVLMMVASFYRLSPALSTSRFFLQSLEKNWWR